MIRLARHGLLRSRALLAIHISNSTKLIKPLLQAGADGYLASATTVQEMLTAIETINNVENTRIYDWLELPYCAS